MSKLPTWEQAEESCESGNGTALERFIYENEPQAFDDEWRKDLAAAIAEQRQPAVTNHCPACEAAATELAEARDDRELLVNRLRAATALNEQLTLEAAEARGASKRMERELADLRARLSACAAAVRAHEERIQGLLDGSEAGRLEAYCEQLRQACHQRLAETVEQKQLADDLRARLAAEAEALSHQAEALSNKGNPMALGLQHAAGRLRALLAEGKEK